MSPRTAEMDRCIEEDLECGAARLETMTHYLAMDGSHAAPGHITRLEDCAGSCRTISDLMLGGSDRHPRTYGVRAEVCRCRAESSEFLAPDEEETPARCAEASCREMAGVAA